MRQKLNELASELMKGGEINIEDLIIQFEPLIAKYTNKLGDEDASQELKLFLIENKDKLVLREGENSEARLVRYMDKILYCEFIRLSKKRSKVKNNEMIYCDAYASSYFLDQSEIYFNEIINILPEKQKQVLRDIFIYQYTEVEIASKLNMTRQGVCNIKKRALSKLREYCDDRCRMFIGAKDGSRIN